MQASTSILEIKKVINETKSNRPKFADALGPILHVPKNLKEIN